MIDGDFFMLMGVLKSYGEQSIEAMSHRVDLRREFCPERDVKNFPVSLKEIKAVEIMEVIIG